jgi:hypothetical protein
MKAAEDVAAEQAREPFAPTEPRHPMLPEGVRNMTRAEGCDEACAHVAPKAAATATSAPTVLSIRLSSLVGREANVTLSAQIRR